MGVAAYFSRFKKYAYWVSGNTQAFRNLKLSGEDGMLLRQHREQFL